MCHYEKITKLWLSIYQTVCHCCEMIASYSYLVHSTNWRYSADRDHLYATIGCHDSNYPGFVSGLETEIKINILTAISEFLHNVQFKINVKTSP